MMMMMMMMTGEGDRVCSSVFHPAGSRRHVWRRGKQGGHSGHQGGDWEEGTPWQWILLKYILWNWYINFLFIYPFYLLDLFATSSYSWYSWSLFKPWCAIFWQCQLLQLSKLSLHMLFFLTIAYKAVDVGLHCHIVTIFFDIYLHRFCYWCVNFSFTISFVFKIRKSVNRNCKFYWQL